MTMTKMGTISYKVVIPSYYPPAFFCLVRLSIFACLFVVLHHFVCDFNSLIVESIWSFLHTKCVDISFYSKLFHTKQQQYHQQQCGRMNDTFNKIWKSMKDQTLFFTITKLIHISSFFLQIFAALLVYFKSLFPFSVLLVYWRKHTNIRFKIMFQIWIFLLLFFILRLHHVAVDRFFDMCSHFRAKMFAASGKIEY